MAEATDELVTITLTGEDWARLRECLDAFAQYADSTVRQVAEQLQVHAGDDEYRAQRGAWQHNQGLYVAFAHDARRLNRAIGRRVDARIGKG
jgi:hypothetical protein